MCQMLVIYETGEEINGMLRLVEVAGTDAVASACDERPDSMRAMIEEDCCLCYVDLEVPGRSTGHRLVEYAGRNPSQIILALV
jgi:hypothetical protein